MHGSRNIAAMTLILIQFMIYLTFISRENETVTPWRFKHVPAPLFHLGVLTSPKAPYFDRYVINSRGWHRDFSPHVSAFTSTEVDKKTAEGRGPASTIQLVNLLPGERDGWSSNLQFWGWKLMHDEGPRAKWYLQADDDTVVIRANLEKLVAKFNHSEPIMLGDCHSYVEPDFGQIAFAQGGAGVVMSQGLMRRLVPLFETCRMKYNNLHFSDARVHACIEFELGIGQPLVCDKGRFGFNGARLGGEDDLNRHKDWDQIISCHEKDPDALKKINKYIAEHQVEREITFGDVRNLLKRNIQQ